MDIVIPSYGRAAKQTTLDALNKAGFTPTLVVQEREWQAYKKYHDLEKAVISILPDDTRTIAPTRDWILQNVGRHDNIVMLDDDLTFYRRRTDDKTKFRDITPTELRAAFEQMNQMLHRFAHVGFAGREGANRQTQDLIFNTRIMRVLGYNRGKLFKEAITFGRLPVMEDFDVALRLLRAGHANVLINTVVHNQAGSGKEGGCSHFRTKELHAESARKLQEFHPRFVTVVEKETKTAWGGGKRIDVRIQWKAAYESGQSHV